MTLTTEYLPLDDVVDRLMALPDGTAVLLEYESAPNLTGHLASAHRDGRRYVDALDGCRSALVDAHYLDRLRLTAATTADTRLVVIGI